MQKGYAYDDVLLIPQQSEVLPEDTDISTNICGLNLHVPVLSSAMDTITEAEMAIAMAESGGVGVIHQNMSKSDQLDKIKRVKSVRQGRVRYPLTVGEGYTLEEAEARLGRRDITGAPVVDDKGVLQGIITRRDFESGNLTDTVESVMTPLHRLFLGYPDMEDSEFLAMMLERRIEKLPIVNKEHTKLLGLVTKKDLSTQLGVTLDSKGRYGVGAAVGFGDLQRMEEHIFELQKAGTDFIVMDSAHAHTKNVADAVVAISELFQDLHIVVGNVVTPQAVQYLVDKCYEPSRLTIKVGIGPGSICTTRSVAGVGFPQFTALQECAKRLSPNQIIADGGISKTGSIPKALLFSNAVMLGSMLAGTDECPGHMVEIGGNLYKSYRGMGSLEAMAVRKATGNRYSQKKVAEGVSSHVPYKGSVRTVMNRIEGALKSSFGYLGLDSISQLHELGQAEELEGVCVECTSSAIVESNVSRELVL